MQTPLIDLLRGGVPALAAFVAAVVAIRIVCRRPALRRLSFALSVAALTGSLALFRALVPGGAPLVEPYLRFLLLFSMAYGAFKVLEVLVVDLLPGRRGPDRAPAILRDVVAAAVGCLILVVLLRASFGVDVAALVATSAALSIVLGLALQETLSNLFAGLALMLERPFEPGDWIQMGDLIGRVQEVSWRAVRLQLIRQEDYLVVPNSVVAKSQIVNMSQPRPIHGHAVEVSAPNGEAPDRVRQVLVEAAKEVTGVLAAPPPKARVARFNETGIVYQLVYYLDDYPRIHDLQGEVLSRVWYAFRRHGIAAAVPRHRRPLARRRQGRRRGAGRRDRPCRRAAQRGGLPRGAQLRPARAGWRRRRRSSRTRPGAPGLARTTPATVSSWWPRAGSRSPCTRRAAVPSASGHAGAGRLLRRDVPADGRAAVGDDPRGGGGPPGDPAQGRAAAPARRRSDGAERLSKTLARRQAERDDALHRAATAEYEGPGADRASQLLGLMRRFFGL